jgi:hypothetical protein
LENSSPSIRISRHERLQLEIKAVFPTQGNKDKSAYVMDVWFHIPPAAGIGGNDYPPDDFYRDIRSYTRLSTPEISLEDLVCGGPGSPLAALGTVSNLASKQQEQKMVRRESRLLGCMLKRALSRELDSLEDLEDPRAGIVNMHGHLLAVLSNWRGLCNDFRSHSLEADTLSALRYVDEELSHQAESACLDLLGMVGESDVFHMALRKTIRGEQQRRIDAGSVTASDGYEDYLLRLGNLKKYSESSLFLEACIDRKHDWLRHAALGMAAGIAMAWAVAAQAFAFFKLGLDLPQAQTLPLLGAFVVVAIFSYILKDRIKASTGAYLSKVISKEDRKTLHLLPSTQGTVAEVSEQMQFIHADNSPEELRKRWSLLERSRLSIVVGGEILWYRRRILMYSREASSSFSRFVGISDILRIHVWRWVRTFSDPKKVILALGADGKMKRKKVVRAYLVDVVARIRDSDGKEEWQAVRVKLNRRGILSVEDIEEEDDSKEASFPGELDSGRYISPGSGPSGSSDGA